MPFLIIFNLIQAIKVSILYVCVCIIYRITFVYTSVSIKLFLCVRERALLVYVFALCLVVFWGGILVAKDHIRLPGLHQGKRPHVWTLYICRLQNGLWKASMEKECLVTNVNFLRVRKLNLSLTNSSVFAFSLVLWCSLLRCSS